jgi:hypothetical protein
MVAHHFPEMANDFLKRKDFPDDTGGTADKKSMRTAPVELAGVKSPTAIIGVLDKFPAVIVTRPDTNQRKTTFWSSALDYLIESFALCGAVLYRAAVHPAALFAVEPARDEGQIPQPRDIYPSEPRGFTSLISTASTQHTTSSELGPGSNHVAPAGYVIAFSDNSSRANGNERSKLPSRRWPNSMTGPYSTWAFPTARRSRRS